ncbi:MAG: hypothetical protein K2Q10_01615, partial [Rhodospirillales bacterium]|nr:hypothetical protein [Rhodospirillales bacterium]
MSIVASVSRFRVRTRIYAGFLAVLALLGMVTLLGLSNGRGFEGALDDYALVAANTIGIADVSAKVAEMRRNVLLYDDAGDPKALERAQEMRGAIGKELSTLRSRVRMPDQRARLDRMTELANSYFQDFDKAVEMRRKRESLFNEQLVGLGGKAVAGMAKLVELAKADNDIATTAAAAVTENALTTGRYWVARFLGSPQQKYADSGRAKFAEV